jgi:transcriptional regulator
MDMYIPHVNAIDDLDDIRAFVAAARVAQLVTVDADGTPLATLLPVIWAGDRLVMHAAKANPQWRSLAEPAVALAIVTGPDAYISPNWYPSKAEHGRAVPTWNYSAVHLTGPVTVHHEPEWLREAVTMLTDLHESGREHPWAVTDAPERYTSGQVRAIVGIEMAVERVEAKSKMSQNRSEADRAGVVAGLRAEPFPGAGAVADAVADPRLVPGR